MVIQATLTSSNATLQARMNTQITTASSDIKLGHALKWDDLGRLAVVMANDASLDNTLPITAAAVQTAIGNIDTLLQNI